MTKRVFFFFVTFLSVVRLSRSLFCHIGSGTQYSLEDCVLGFCSNRVINGVRTYACNGLAVCQSLPSTDYCCRVDGCNLNNDLSLPVYNSNHANEKFFIRKSSFWTYNDQNAFNGSDWKQTVDFLSPLLKTSKAPFTSDQNLTFTNTILSTSQHTVYFRSKLFLSLDDVAYSERLNIRMLFSDGIAIYINGKEIHTENLPSQYTHDSFANAQVQHPDKYKLIAIDLTKNLDVLREGENVIAAEVHQYENPQRITFDLEISIVYQTSSPFPRHRSLIRKGSSWRVKRDGTDMFSVGNFFNLSSDSSFSLEDISTPFSINTPQTFPVYLRIGSVARSSSWVVTEYLLRIRSDNGFIVFLNGKEFARYNIQPTGNVDHSTRSLRASRQEFSKRYLYFSNSDISLLATGNTNIISAVLFPSAGETNFTFDFELIAVTAERTCSSFDTKKNEVNSSFPFNHEYELQPCVFPFIFQGIVQNECITEGKSSNWCSLTSNYDIDLQWGYCNQCTTSCAFPFNVENRKYSKCVKESNRAVAWCPITFSNINEWAYCNPQNLTEILIPSTNPPTSSPAPDDEEETKEPSKNNTPIIVGVVVPIVVIAIILLIGLAFFLKKQRETEKVIEQILETRSQGNTTQITMQSQLSHTQGHSKMVNNATKSQYDQVYSSNPFLFINQDKAKLDIEGQTLLNTQMEKSLPGFLMLTDLSSQIRIGKVISKGGNGVLYEGSIVDPALRDRCGFEIVAVKKIDYPEDLQSRSLEAFHHEITAMWAASFHPNILKLLAYDDNSTTIITPLYDGDLSYFLHRNQTKLVLKDSMAIYIVTCIAKGLKELHHLSIIHRDMKTANVLLKFFADGDFPHVVICDFGISRIANNHNLVNEKKLELFGLSPRYASPEIFARSYTNSGPLNQEIEMKCDVYAFGVIVWEVLSRKVPWEGLNEGQIENKVRSGELLPDPITDQSAARIILLNLSKECRKVDPIHRPNFDQIVNNLEKLESDLR